MKIFDNVYRFISEKFSNNSYLINLGNNLCLVIDPSWNVDKIIDFANENNLEIKYIFLTHTHYDHVGDSQKILEKFPSCYYVVSKNVRDVIKDGVTDLFFGYNFKIEKSKIILANDQDTYLDFKFYLFPGHSPCSMVIEYKNLLFTGDFIFKNSIGRVDLDFGDWDTMQESIKRFLTLFKPLENICILPGHNDYDLLENILKINPYLNYQVDKNNNQELDMKEVENIKTILKNKNYPSELIEQEAINLVKNGVTLQKIIADFIKKADNDPTTISTKNCNDGKCSSFMYSNKYKK